MDPSVDAYSGPGTGTAGVYSPHPGDFTRYLDYRGQGSKGPIPLKNGQLNPDPMYDPQFVPTIELYEQSNFALLGIPQDL